MYNLTKTSTILGNTGMQRFAGGVGKWKFLVLVPKGTEIATKTLAATKDTWEDNLNESMANRWFIAPLIFNGEPTQEDAVKETSDFGYESDVRDGKLNYKITFEEMSIYNKTQINKLDNAKWDAFVITEKGYILGTSYDGVKFKAYALDYFNILPETQATGSTNAHVMAELRFTNIQELNQFQVFIRPSVDSEAPTSWSPDIELVGIKDLIVEVNSMVAAETSITLKGYDSVPYSGAVKEDIYMRKTSVDGAAITILTLVEGSTPGTYTATFAAQTTGTFYFSLYNQPLAATQGFETPIVASITATIS